MSQELKPCESCAAPKHQHYPQRNGDSICAACGAPYGLATAPVPPAGEWEKLAKHLAYYLPSALVSHQHMMTPETLSDALEALHKVRNMPALPAVSGVGRMPERLTSDDDRVPNMHSLQKVAWCSGYGHAIDACTPIVTRLQAENAALQQRLNTADQRVDELQSESFEALYNAAIEERDAAQSELTKARELLKECVDCVRYGDEFDLPVTTMKRVDDLLAHQSAPAAAPLDHVHGDVLPPVGSTVQIQLGDSGWFDHTVTGYYAWPNHGLDKNVHRVFVRVKDSSGTPNARLLADIGLPTASAQQ